MYICVINLLGKTMNVQRIIFIAFIAAFLSSCHTEDIPVPEKNSDNTEQTEDSEDDPEDDPEQDPEDKPVNEELLLGLDATLNNMVESRRGVINAWQSGNEIGLYTEIKTSSIPMTAASGLRLSNMRYRMNRQSMPITHMTRMRPT